MSESHSIFVTGLDFVPSSAASKCLMGPAECSLLSISADKSIQLHHVIPTGMDNSDQLGVVVVRVK